MNIRDDGYQNTKDELRRALDRLRQGKPQHIKLRQRLLDGKVIKINAANVEMEAGKGNAALKRHTDVKNEIFKAENERKYGSTLAKTLVKDDSKFKELESKLNKVLEERKKLKLDKRNLNTELAIKDEVIKLQATKMDEMTTALWAAIPPNEIELRMATAKKMSTVAYLNAIKEKTTETDR